MARVRVGARVARVRTNAVKGYYRATNNEISRPVPGDYSRPKNKKNIDCPLASFHCCHSQVFKIHLYFFLNQLHKGQKISQKSNNSGPSRPLYFKNSRTHHTFSLVQPSTIFSIFVSFSKCLSPIPFYWNCFTSHLQWSSSFHQPTKSFCPRSSWPFCCLWYYRPSNSAWQADSKFWHRWSCPFSACFLSA